MNKKEWAKKEVEIVCNKTVSHDASMYQNVLEAFNILCNDKQSGFSFSIAENILIRLMEGLPLTSIKDEDFDQNDKAYSITKYSNENNIKSELQCPRMSSLFREEYLDGTVKYTDVDRVVCYDFKEPSIDYHNGLIASIVDEMYPITMPYYPSVNKFKVYTEEFLFDEGNGDYDTIVVYYLITPEGDKVEINKYFTEKENKMVEISKKEFLKIKKHSKIESGK